MGARQITSRSMKSVSGAAALAIGFFLLSVNLDGIAAKISDGVSAPTETVGILPAIGLAGLHAARSIAFDHAGFLSSLLQILVSFWPLILIVTGVALLRPLAQAGSGPQDFRKEGTATSVGGDR